MSRRRKTTTVTATPVTPTTWNDAGLRSHQRIAARFAQYADGHVLFVDGAGWHRWDGTRWARDHGDERTADLLTRLLTLSWGQAIGDKDLAADVKASMTASGSRGVLALAAPRMFAHAIDADPYVLNVANGTLDLHTLELRDPDPADHITKITRGAYRPDERSDEWARFLASTLPDPEVRAFLQRWAGVALIGRVVEHALVVANGSGRNGKGVLSDSISHTLGDYAVTAPATMLTTGRDAGRSAGELASLMHLRGARWAAMSELAKGSRLNEALMKALTGGDTIHAKHMGQNPVDFAPSHSFFMLTNDLPEVDAAASAVWARMLVVPFTEDFTGREDRGLRERLELEADAVLTWAVEGLREYRRRGLDAPAAVTRRTAAYREHNDPLARFIDEECVRHPDARIERAVFAGRFNVWAASEGAPRMTPTAIAKQMNARGEFGETAQRGKRMWVGVTTADDEAVTA